MHGADRIKGITVEINGDTTGLSKALSDVNKEIRSFLYFSVPDERPLTKYEKWMPDFMAGFVKGIEKRRGLVETAV